MRDRRVVIALLLCIIALIWLPGLGQICIELIFALLRFLAAHVNISIQPGA